MAIQLHDIQHLSTPGPTSSSSGQMLLERRVEPLGLPQLVRAQRRCGRFPTFEQLLNQCGLVGARGCMYIYS